MTVALGGGGRVLARHEWRAAATSVVDDWKERRILPAPPDATSDDG